MDGVEASKNQMKNPYGATHNGGFNVTLRAKKEDRCN
jgi:hypothetical protein